MPNPDARPTGGQTTISLSIEGTTPAVAFKQLTLDVSYDDGRTWQHAQVRPVSGRSDTAQLPPPAAGAGHYASLRIHAADTHSDALDETVIRSFPVNPQ